MELLKGGDLSAILKNGSNVSMRRRFHWVIDLSKAIFVMHSRNFMHRDLKPANILLTKEQYLKLGDFGIAKNSLEDAGCHTSIGTDLYKAPEVSSRQYTTKADIFSFGLVMNQIMTGVVHTRDSGFLKEVRLLAKSPFMLDMVQKCLEIDPEDRPTAAQIMKKLSEFDKFFWKKLDMTEKSYGELSCELKDQTFDRIYLKFKNQELNSI